MSELAPFGQVPEGTQSDEWKTMSAAVAHAIWQAQRATSAPSDGRTNAEAWTDAATDYRAQVRYVLRELEKTGIRLRPCTPDDGVTTGSEDWRKHTARAAWLLWLKARRSVLPADEPLEAETWEYVSTDQRKLIRGVIEALSAKGIHFLK